MNWNHFRDILIDELSVEGLDGCTFNHLYSNVKPLFFSTANQLTNEIYFRSYTWKVLLSCSYIELYELPEKLLPMSAELAIENQELNHRGYSPSYYQRKLISNRSAYLILENISTIDRIHLVVEQNIREFRILQGRFDTKRLFSKYEYALLECICKTRSKGIQTSGNESLAKIFNLNSKSLFYYLKQLISLDIIKKLNLTRQLSGTLKQPILIMTRFITQNDYINSKHTIIDRVKAYLEQFKNQSCERNYLKTYLSLGEKSFRSLMRKCKRLNFIEKYNKTMNEYDLKKFLNIEQDSSSLKYSNSRTRLRSYTFFRLKSNNTNEDYDEEIASSSDDNEQSEQDEDEEEGREEETVTIDDEDLPLSEASSQLDLTNLRLYVDRPFHFQYYELLEQVKDTGLSQRDLANICHLSFYSARSEIKSLTKNMKHISLKSVQLNQKGKIMENRIVLKKYMPTTTIKSSSPLNNNVRQQIISKTPRVNQRKSNKKQKETVEATTVESLPTLPVRLFNSSSLIKCEPVDAEQLDNEPLLSRLISSEILWRPSIQPVPNATQRKKSKTRTNPVKRINVKREHRLDLIRAYMHEHPICTLSDLRVALMSKERDEGLTIHMDRKTLDKLIDELEKIHQFLFRFTARIKQSRTVICVAMNSDDITPNCERIQQFKIELSQDTIEVPSSSSATTNKTKQISHKNLSNMTTKEQEQMLEEAKESDDDSKLAIDHLFNNGIEEEKMALLKKKPLENIAGFGNCYGYVYKFQRCAILHKFLFYVLYGYEGKSDNEITESNLDAEQPLVSTDPQLQSVLDSIPNTRRYIGSNQSVNWKTFVPPVDNRGRSIPSGCLYLDDLLMCMPVSIFLAIVYVPYKVPGLMELLSHPTKRYILVRNLPAEMRYPLVVRRQYLYRIIDVLKYLSILGLITFVDRPTKSRLEKLNTLIYLHPKSYLINTINQTNSSNEPIGNMSNYSKQIYNFISLTNVNRFWFDLIEIALNTYRIKIFSRKQDRLHMADILKQSVKPISIENINEIKTPLGKSNGPAGFDYDLYLFLRKSWKLPYNNKRVLKLLNREATHCCIPVCELRVPIDVALKRSYTRHLAQKRKHKNRKRGTNIFSSNVDTRMNSILTTTSSVFKTKRNINMSIKSLDGIEYYGHLSRYIIPYELLNQIQFIERRKKLLFQYIRERNKIILNRYHELLRDKSISNKNNKKRRKQKLNNKQKLDDEEHVHSTVLRVRWSSMEERVISVINASLAFYLPRRQTNHSDVSQDANSIGGRRPAAFLPFNKEVYCACLIRILPRSARTKTPQNVVRKIKNDMAQQTRLTQLEHLSLLCSTDTYLLKFRNESKRYLKQRYRSNENFFFLLFERIYIKFQNFIRTGYLHCIPQDTIDYLPKSKRQLLEQYNIIGKPASKFYPINQLESTKSILSSTINMATHSSLLSNERSGTIKAFILHYIFSQYPESLLNEIVYRLMHTDAVITLTKSNEIQRKISSEASTFLAGRAYHINQRYTYRWYTYMPGTVLHETYSWINENILSKIDIEQVKDEMIITVDVEQQNDVAIAASLVTLFDSNHFDIHLALPINLDNEPEMMMTKLNKNANDDETNTEDDNNNDSDNNNEHERVFQQVLQSARRIDQTRYENINKRKHSIEDENATKKAKITTNETTLPTSCTNSLTPIRYQCSECSKSFISRTNLVRHRHRQHEQHRQIKSSKSKLRPGSSSTPNPLGRGRHATDTSSLSCCSIKFVLSHEFLREQFQNFYIQKSLHTIDKLIERYPFYSAVYEQEQQIESNENNLLHNIILNSHEFGLSFYQLYKQVKSSMTFSQCVQQLNDYLMRGIIIAAGSRIRVYIHRKYARSWLIYSIRFRQNDTNNNLETLLTSVFVDSSSSTTTMQTDTTQNNKQVKQINFSNSENIINNNNQLISNQFERIVFIPRPWKSTDGSINFAVLKRMMESLLLFMNDHPGVNLEYLYEHYRCVLQPVAINDCIELLQQMNCLETVQVALKRTVEKQINLYSNEISDDDDDDDEEEISYDMNNDLERLLFKTNYDDQQTTLYCFPTYDCLARFGVSFPSSLIDQQRGIDRMPFPSY